MGSSIRMTRGAREADYSGFWFDELRQRIEIYISGVRTGYFDVANGWTFEDPVAMEETLAVTGASTLTGAVAIAGELSPDGGVLAGSVARGALTEDALAAFEIPIRNWMAEDGAALGIAEEAGTFFVQDGTNQMYLQGEEASNETEVSVMKTSFVLPESYIAGQSVNVRFGTDVTGAGTLGTCTLDLSAYKQALDGSVGSDLVNTAARTVSATASFAEFELVDTGLAPGDVFVLIATASIAETAATAIRLIITSTQLRVDIKG